MTKPKIKPGAKPVPSEQKTAPADKVLGPMDYVKIQRLTLIRSRDNFRKIKQARSKQE